jgi:hypothetical protein
MASVISSRVSVDLSSLSRITSLSWEGSSTVDHCSASSATTLIVRYSRSGST